MYTCCPKRSSRVPQILTRRSKAPWDSVTASWAAQNGHLHILEYLVERKFDEYTEYACERAAESGHLDCLKYLRETAKAPWDSWAVRRAHENNHPECLQYLLDNNCPLPYGWRYENGELHDVNRIRIRIKLNVITERERERERKRKRDTKRAVRRKYPPGVTETKPSTERERNIQQRARFARNLLKHTQKHTHTQSIIVTQTKHTRTRDLQTRVSPYSYIP